MPKAKAKTKGVPTPPVERRSIGAASTCRLDNDAERPSTSVAYFQDVVIPSFSGSSSDVGKVSKEDPRMVDPQLKASIIDTNLKVPILISKFENMCLSQKGLPRQPAKRRSKDLESRYANAAERPSTSATYFAEMVIPSSSWPRSDVAEVPLETHRMGNPQSGTSVASSLKVPFLISKFENMCLRQKGLPCQPVKRRSKDLDSRCANAVERHSTSAAYFTDVIIPSSSSSKSNVAEVPSEKHRMGNPQPGTSFASSLKEGGPTSPDIESDQQQQQPHGTNVQPRKEVPQDSGDYLSLKARRLLLDITDFMSKSMSASYASDNYSSSSGLSSDIEKIPTKDPRNEDTQPGTGDTDPSGESYHSLSFSYRVGRSTISYIVDETCSALYESLKDRYIKMPDTEERWREIAAGFERKWNYAFCLGALDGKHIRIKNPQNSGSAYYNYKSFYSVILMALVDADYKFVYVSVGAPGRNGDAGVYGESSLKVGIDRELLNIPNPGYLRGTEDLCHYHIVGDDAFPLGKHMMKPYPHRNLAKDVVLFNYRFSRARRVVENAFGILAARFRVFQNQIELEPGKVSGLLLASCCLHNFLVEKQAHMYISNLVDIDGKFDGNTTLTELQTSRNRNATVSAKNQRESLKKYFLSTEGSVPWQTRIVNKKIQQIGSQINE